MYWITLYCNDTLTHNGVVVVVWYLWVSNTIPGYETLICSALDCGNNLVIDGQTIVFHGTGYFVKTTILSKPQYVQNPNIVNPIS